MGLIRTSEEEADARDQRHERPAVEGRRQPANWQVWDWLTLLGVLASNVIMLSTLRQYGFTYDEPPHIRYGERILRFYTSGFEARGYLRSSYVGGFDLSAALLRRISPLDAFLTNHVLCIFVAQCALLGAWKLGRLLGGGLGGFCAWLFLLLTPVYYSHQFNNPKDIPFAAGYIWGLYVIAKALVAYERSPGALEALLARPSYFVQLALALGLGMSVRVGGALLIVYLLLALGGIAFQSHARRDGIVRGEWKRVLLRLLLTLAGAWLLLLVFWPKAFISPVQGPASALESVTHYKAFASPTLLRGKLVSSHKLPWDYLPTYFLVQLSEFVLLLLLGGTIWATRRCWSAIRQRRRWPLALALVVMAIFFPPAYAIARRSVLYDGLRHFLFIIPPIAVLSGVFFAEIFSRLLRRHWTWAAALGAALLLVGVDQATAMVETHPYQHVHFNRLSGGTRSAVGRYETEYYGALYQELGQEVARALWQNNRDAYLNRTYRLAACGSNLFVTRNFPLNFQYESMRRAKNADLFATYPRDRCLERLTRHPAFVKLRRAGATLGVARDLKGVTKGRKRATKGRNRGRK